LVKSKQKIFNSREAIKLNAHRYETLDHLRGLACLTVLIFHSLLINNDLSFLKNPFVGWSPLRIVWSGHQAVILFFVLSGFALYMMYTYLNSGKNKKYLYFLASRMARLYPAYAFSIVFSAAVYLTLDRYELKPSENVVIKNLTPSIKEILLQLTMLGQFNVLDINPPIWSVIVETRVSILFPFILLILNKHPKKLLASLFLTSIATGFFLLANKDKNYHLSSWVLTPHYLTFFALGATVARYRNFLIEKSANLDKKQKSIIIAISMLLYTYAFDFFWEEWLRVFADLLLGIGSCGIILFFLTTPRIHSKVLLFLGKISFSLYLIHFPCLVATSTLLSNNTPAYLLNAASITASIIISTATWKLIERPSLSLSRSIRKPA